MTKIRKAIITAAGHGTRQYPASNTVQKELFPLVDADGYAKPTLQIIVEECLASEIEEICIVVNPDNADAIRGHFRGPNTEQKKAFQSKEWAQKLAAQLAEMEQRITYVVQREQKGYGHAVYQAKEWAGDDPSLVMLGDHVYLAPKTRCARQVADVFERHEAPVSSVTPIPETEVTREGLIKGDQLEHGLYRVTRFVEKPSVEQARSELQMPGVPEGQYLGHFGIHAFPPAIFEKLEYLIDHDILSKGEIQLTSAQELLVKDSPLYLACTVDGMRFDMGVPEGLIKTQVALAMASPLKPNVFDAINSVKRLGF